MPSDSLQEAVTLALRPLVGHPLTITRRYADMRAFHFGPLEATKPTSRTIARKFLDRSRGQGLAGAFVIHVQCPWRIERGGRILVGRADLWEPASHLEWTPEWTYDDGNLQDERLRELLDLEGSRARRSFTVEAVAGLPHGGAVIELSGGAALTLFPDGSISEDWRLLGRGVPSHFVIIGGRLEPQDE